MVELTLGLEAASSLARAALVNRNLGSKTCLSLLELCRRTGALEEAHLLINRLVETSSATELAQSVVWLKAILEGAALPREQGDAECLPSPFVRQTGFLEAATLKQIREQAYTLLQKLEPAGIYDGDVTVVDEARRRSSVLVNAKEMRPLILPAVREVLSCEDISKRLSLGSEPSGIYELQFSRHGPGSFFRPHADVGLQAPTRAISFVFYFGLVPSSFSGGNLVIYDTSAKSAVHVTNGYTGLVPEDNSIVFFDSRAIHEVQPVTVLEDRADFGRFALNGWIHW